MYEESKRKHYENNREQYIQQAKDRREKLRQLVRNRKDQPCGDCGIAYPFYVMQLDHVRGEKVTEVGNLVKQGNLTLLLTELDKCDVVCANCHAARTWLRANK